MLAVLPASPDDGGGFIEMSELDPEAAAGIEAFRNLLREKSFSGSAEHTIVNTRH